MPKAEPSEIARQLTANLPLSCAQATVLTGVRRCGKSTLQVQLMQREGNCFYCNFEDTRLYGMGPEDFSTIISAMDDIAGASAPIFLDELQEVPEWQRLVRELIDRGRAVCLTGSNASLLGREFGSKLTGRHLSFEVFPFSYGEYCLFTGKERSNESLLNYLDDGGFPVFLHEHRDQILQELVRDIIYRDVAARHGLRETRHVMNLLLFLFGNTGQPFSFQSLSKNLAVPTVTQVSRYIEFLQDAYLLFTVAKFSPSFKQRVIAPAKYYAIDNGLRRVNSPQIQPDRGRRLENAIALQLRRHTRELFYASERDLWECDFITSAEAIQACFELTPVNQKRELRGLHEASHLLGNFRALIVTANQSGQLRENGLNVEIIPAWQWLE